MLAAPRALVLLELVSDGESVRLDFDAKRFKVTALPNLDYCQCCECDMSYTPGGLPTRMPSTSDARCLLGVCCSELRHDAASARGEE
eukprot:5403164-Pyramimonas_sp.AAC.1